MVENYQNTMRLTIINQTIDDYALSVDGLQNKVKMSF